MEHTINGHNYQASKLDAFKQFHILRRLAPVLSGLAPLASLGGAAGADIEKVKAWLQNDPAALEKALAAIAGALASLPDADADMVLHGLLSAVARQNPQGLGWSPVSSGGVLMFQDIDLPGMLRLAWLAIQENFSNFFAGLPSVLSAAAPKVKGQ